MRKRAGGDVTKFGRAVDRLFSQLPGTLHLALAPSRSYEICSCEDSRVVAEMEPCLRVAVGPIIDQRPFQVRSGLQELALIEAGCAETTAGDAGFRGVAAFLGLPQEALGRPLRLAMLAPRDASHPLRVVGWESFGGAFRPARQFAGAGKGGPRFLGGEALGPHHGLAVGRLKVQLAP